MAKRALYDLTLNIEANSAALAKGIQESNAKLNNFEKNYKGTLSSIKTSVLAYAAVAATAFKTVQKILESTQMTGDKLQITIAGLKDVATTTAQNIANLDFSVSLRDAKKAAEEYASVLDDLGDRKRSVEIISAKNYEEVVKLKGELRDVTLSEDKRLAVSKRIQEIGEEELELRKKIATEALDGINKYASDKYKIDLESAKLLKDYVTDYALYTKEEQDALNNAMAAQKKLSFYEQNTLDFKYKEGKRYKNLLEDLNVATALVPEEMQKYIALWRPINDLSDKQRDEIANIVIEWYKANSAIQTYLNTADKVENKLASKKFTKETTPSFAKTSGISMPTFPTFVAPSTTDLQSSYISILGVTNDQLEQQMRLVSSLEGVFGSLFSSINEGFAGMAKSFINMIEQMVAEMLAKAAVFGILKLLFPEVFIGMDLFKAGSFLKFISPFAGGTNYAPGGLALVGEQGPELVNLPRGSQVFSNSDTNNLLAGKVVFEIAGTKLYGVLSKQNKIYEAY